MNRLLLLVLLFAFGMNVNAGSSLSLGSKAKGIRNSVRSLLQKNFAEIPKLARVASASAVLGLALALSPANISYSQENGANELFDVVDANSAEHLQGIFFLHASFPFDVENPDLGTEELGFHLAFIGRDDHGHSLLLARDRPGGVDILETLVKIFNDGGTFNLFAWDGEVARDVHLELLDTFQDATDGTFNVALLGIDHMNLDKKGYPRVPVASGFPYATEKELELATYKQSYLPYLTIEEFDAVNAGAIPLHTQTCSSFPHPLLAMADQGLTTCGNPLGSVAVGAFLFHEGKLVGIQSRRTPRDDMALWLSSAIPQDAVDFANALPEKPLAVDAKGKVATTWGDLKRKH